MATKELAAPRHSGAAMMRAESFDEADGTIEMIFTTGAKVRRYSWTEGPYDEELVVSPESVRLERLNAGAPFLDTHSSWELRDIIGSVVPGSAVIENGVGKCKVKLSRAASDADTVQKIRDGIIRNISVGYRYHRVEKTDGQEGDPALWRVTDWEPLEVSAVPIPADPGSQIRSAPKDEAGERYDFVLLTRDENPAAEATSNGEDQMTVKTTSADAGEARGNDTTTAPVQTGMSEQDVKRMLDEQMRAERERSTEIRKLADHFNLRAFGDEHVGSGTSLDEFRKLILDKMATESDRTAPQGGGNHVVVTGPSEDEKRAEAMIGALLHRYSPGQYELTAHAREYRGRSSLLDIARECLEARGVKTRHMSRLELVTEATRAGLHSTSDFPNILAAVSNKILRAAYEAAPQTFRPLVKETTVPDFKPVNRVQIGEAPMLEKVNEKGEFTRGSLAEGKETYSIATFGKVVGITRQVIINDDLNAFARLSAGFGAQAAQLESDLVWAQILGNPTMGDGVALFHANHGNLGTGAAISSITGVSEGRKLIGLQTGLDGKTVLNLDARYLIVPRALQTVAEQFLGQIYAAKTADLVPQSLKNLQVITEPRLDNGITRADLGLAIAGSSSNWYMAASPDQVDLVELAYLEGARGLFTESRNGFDVDGVEVKVRLDVGAKTLDHRGFYKNPN